MECITPPSLIDTMQIHFDVASLDKLSDPELLMLQTKTDKTIAGWKQQEQPLDPDEELWLSELVKLADTIRNILNLRYGCND